MRQLNHSCLWFYAEKNKPLLAAPSLKIAGFDLDDTLIRTKSGAKFRQCASDWQWNNDPKSDHTDLCSILRNLFFIKKYTIVVFSNQTLGNDVYARDRFNRLIEQINEESDVPIHVMCTTKINEAAKPSKSMWDMMIEEFKSCGLLNQQGTVSLNDSFFVGDNADSDKKFAENVGVTFFHPANFVRSEYGAIEWSLLQGFDAMENSRKQRNVQQQLAREEQQQEELQQSIQQNVEQGLDFDDSDPDWNRIVFRLL